MWSLMVMTLLLGMRHGLDLDHIAMIDSMTRKASLKSAWAGWIGLFFSFGHGFVIILFCTLIAFFFKHFSLPYWLNRLMLIFSILLLILFGLFNLYALIRKKSGGIKYQILHNGVLTLFTFLKSSVYLQSIIIGIIFAISFDTLSQVAVFALSAAHSFQAIFSVMLGVVFMIGMMLTDGINGYLVFSLIKKSNQFSVSLSRYLSFLIGLFSTSIGVIEAIRLV